MRLCGCWCVFSVDHEGILCGESGLREADSCVSNLLRNFDNFRYAHFHSKFIQEIEIHLL